MQAKTETYPMLGFPYFCRHTSALAIYAANKRISVRSEVTPVESAPLLIRISKFPGRWCIPRPHTTIRNNKLPAGRDVPPVRPLR